MAPQEASYLFKGNLLEKWMDHLAKRDQRSRRSFYSDEPQSAVNASALFLISETASPINALEITPGSALDELTHISDKFIHDTHVFGQCYLPAVSYPIVRSFTVVLTILIRNLRLMQCQLILFVMMYLLFVRNRMQCLI